MRERPLLYFALGVLLTTSLGAVSLREDGIELPDGSVLTSAKSQRAFYLTDNTFLGGQAKQACDNVGFDGTSTFHMASLWEIRDTTQLRYAASDELSVGFGLIEGGDGAGPPATVPGWIRTGGASLGLVDENYGPGLANCGSWTELQNDWEGTIVELSACWDCGQPQSAWGAGWTAYTTTCGDSRPVWCVED